MDRNTVTGLILIFFIMMAWAFYSMPSEEELQQQRELALQEQLAEESNESDEIQQDSLDNTTEPQGPQILAEDSSTPPEMGIFQSGEVTDTTYTTIETTRYRAVFTNVGAGPAQYEVKKDFDTYYYTWDQVPVQMIGDTTKSAYYLGFLSNESYNVETDRLLFRQLTDTNEIVLSNGNDSAQLQYVLELGNGGRILYTYTFYSDHHLIDLEINLEGLDDVIVDNVDFGWKPQLNFTERDRTQDGMFASAYIYAGGVLENFSVDGSTRDDMTVNGNIDWVATKTKFFTQIIEPVSETNSAMMVGEIDGPKDEQGTQHHYQASVQSSLPDNGTLEYELYIGPLDFYELRDFDERAFDMVDISYGWMRWFADPLVKWIIIPYFTFASNFITNYGLLIILFGILIKLALSPLTKKSFESMAAMRELQPEMKELQEKYKDNPKKQQEATIKLYKKAKVNPLGGCLPMLLQFPILITLWRYFQSSIIIRQESFLWASDLSSPDYILNLPFSIPFLGDQLAGFVLLMTAAMVVQSKISGGMSTGSAPAGAPNMKAFMYFLPIMLLFVFNNFAAGLSLYYLIYNVMSIGQQYMINKKSDQKMEAKETGKKKKK